MSLSPALQRIGVKPPEQVIAMFKRAGELKSKAKTIEQILQNNGIHDSKIELNPEKCQIILTVHRQDGHLIGEIKKNVQANTGLGVREEVALADRTKVQLVFEPPIETRVEAVLADLQVRGTVAVDRFPNGINHAVITFPKEQNLGPRTIDQIRERLWNKGENGISVVIK